MNRFTSSWMLRHPNPVDVRAEHISREGKTLKPAKGIVQPPFFFNHPCSSRPTASRTAMMRKRRRLPQKGKRADTQTHDGHEAD